MPRKISDYLKEPGKTGPAADVDVVIKKTVEATAAELVKALLAEIRRLREEVGQLRASIERLEKACSRGERPRRQGAQGRDSKLLDKLEDALAESGYLLASQSYEKLGVSPYRLRSLAVRAGARIVELENDYAVVDPEAYKEFVLLLSTVSTPDPGEAAKRLGKYGKLFEALRRSSMAYYDTKRKAWRILE